MLYEELINQYNNLTDEEKNALLVYKSRLGRAINSLNNDEEEIEKIYTKYKKLLENPKNMFLAFTVFKDIHFDDLNQFKNSLLEIEKKVKEISNKIVLPEDMTVYRALSIPNEEDLIEISKSSLISTSFNINECSKFLILTPGRGYKHYLYQINLEKFSPVAICPYAILLDEKEERLILTQGQDQKEIILIKENYIFENVLETETILNNDISVNVIIVDAKIKEDIKNNKL